MCLDSRSLPDVRKGKQQYGVGTMWNSSSYGYLRGVCRWHQNMSSIKHNIYNNTNINEPREEIDLVTDIFPKPFPRKTLMRKLHHNERSTNAKTSRPVPPKKRFCAPPNPATANETLGSQPRWSIADCIAWNACYL